MSKVAYEFQQRSASIVTSLCRSIRREGIETFPSKSTLIRQFDRGSIHKLFASLRPDNCIAYLVAKNLESHSFVLDKREKWMGAKYGVQRWDHVDLKKWGSVQAHPEIHYPRPNRFIPDNVSLVGNVNNAVKKDPILIKSSPAGRLFFHQDDKHL